MEKFFLKFISSSQAHVLEAFENKVWTHTRKASKLKAGMRIIVMPSAAILKDSYACLIATAASDPYLTPKEEWSDGEGNYVWRVDLEDLEIVDFEELPEYAKTLTPSPTGIKYY